MTPQFSPLWGGGIWKKPLYIRLKIFSMYHKNLSVKSDTIVSCLISFFSQHWLLCNKTAIRLITESKWDNWRGNWRERKCYPIEWMNEWDLRVLVKVSDKIPLQIRLKILSRYHKILSVKSDTIVQQYFQPDMKGEFGRSKAQQYFQPDMKGDFVRSKARTPRRSLAADQAPSLLPHSSLTEEYTLKCWLVHWKRRRWTSGHAGGCQWLPCSIP